MPRTKGQRCACGQSFGTEFRLAVHRRSHGARCHRCRTSFPDARLFREHSLLCRVSAATGPAEPPQPDLTPQTDASSVPAQPPQAETSPKTPQPIDTPLAETSSHADESFAIAEEEEPPELEEEEVSTVTILQALPHQDSPSPDGAEKSHEHTESPPASQGQKRGPPEGEETEASEGGEQGATADFEKASGSTSAAEPSEASVPQEGHSALSCKHCSQVFADRSELRHHRTAEVCSRESEDLVVSEASASGAMEAASPEEPAESDEPEVLSEKAEEAELSVAELPKGKTKVSCKECGFSTPYPAQLRRHLMSAVGCRNHKILSSVTEDAGIVQRPDGDFECKECGYSCRQPAAMRRHKDGKAACRIRQNRSLVLASPHVRLEEVPPETGEEATGKQRLVCTRCCFAVAESLPFDMKAHLERPQACLMRRRRRAFQRLVSEGRLATAEGGGASCTACAQSFPSEPRALRHLQSARACRLALAAKATSPDCPSCDFIGGDVEELRSHLRAGRCQALDEDAPEEKKAKALLDGELPFACDKCSYSSISFGQLRKHLESEQGCLIRQKQDGMVELQASGVVSRTALGEWKCGRCGLKSDDNSRMLRHLTSKSFEACRRIILSRRIQNLGTVCPGCGEDKGDSAKLRAHLQTKKCSAAVKVKEETDVKPVVELLRYVDEDLECEKCPYTTRTRTSLVGHLGSKENCRREKRRAHLDRLVSEGRLRRTEDGGFACTKCPHEVASHQAVSIFTHIQGPACEQEQRRVELAKLVSDGRVTKIEEGGFRCAKCRFVTPAFRSYAMMKHIEGQGCGMEQKRLELAQLVEAGRVLKTEDGVFRCAKCPLAIDRAHTMLHHVKGKGCTMAQAAAIIRTLTADETTCPECGKKVDSPERLPSHVRRCIAVGSVALDESTASPSVKVESGRDEADGSDGKDSFACESCPFKTHLRGSLMSHLGSRDGCLIWTKRDKLQKLCDAGRAKRTLDGYCCVKCRFEVPSLRSLDLVGHIQGQGCGMEQRRLELLSLVEADRVLKAEDGSFQCAKCPFTAKLGYHMLNHVQGKGCALAQAAAVIKTLGDGETTCPECRKDLGSSHKMQYHLRRCLIGSEAPDESLVSATVKLEVGDSEADSRESFVCDACPYKTHARTSLMNHTTSRDGCWLEEKRQSLRKLCAAGRVEQTLDGLRCTKCGFSTPSLRAHQMVTHVEGVGCGQEQRRQEFARLIDRGRVTKATDGSFRCAKCPQTFESHRASFMLSHVQGKGCALAQAAAILKTLDAGVTACPRCEAEEGSREKLQAHLRRCLAEPEQLDESVASAAVKQELDAPEASGRERFVCEACPFETHTRTSLMGHVKSKDGCWIEKKRAKVQRLVEEGILKRTAEEGFRCAKCGHEAVSGRGLHMVRHLEGQGCAIEQRRQELAKLIEARRVHKTPDGGFTCTRCPHTQDSTQGYAMLAHVKGQGCARAQASALIKGISDGDTVCPRCQKDKETHEKLQRHVRRCSEGHAKLVISSSSMGQDAFVKMEQEDAVESTRESFACESCPYVTHSRTCLTGHLNSTRDTCDRERKRAEIRRLCEQGRLARTNDGGLRCLRCGYEVRAEITQLIMLGHLRGKGCDRAQIQVRLRALVSQGRVEETADEGLRCAECGFEVDKGLGQRLLQHLDGPKACAVQKAIARFKGIHSPDCPVCGFASKNMNAMKGHVRYKHPDYLSTPSTTSEAAKDKADNETAAQAEESIAAPTQAEVLVKQEPEEVANESAPAPEDCAPPEQGPGSTPAAEPEQLSAPAPFSAPPAELNEDEGEEGEPVVPEELIPDEVTETAETEAVQDEDEDETVPEEEEEEEEPPSLDCRDCGLRTETEDDLAVHLEDAAECRSIALAAYLAKLFQGVPEGQCAHCDFASADGEELLAHAHRPDACRLEPAIRAMAKEELAECVCCGREMRGLAAVRAHLDTVDDCRQATLLTLQTTAASALEPCEECGTAFGSGGRLAAHYAAPFGCRLARETPPEAQLASDEEDL